MTNPGPTHIASAKRILRYLAGTRSRGITYRGITYRGIAYRGITYRRGSTDASLGTAGLEVMPNQLTASADADHAGADDRRSVSGWAVMLGGAMVPWASKRQPVTAWSSTESEFYSVSQCARDCVYLRRVMEIVDYKQTGPTPMAQDNNACIYLVKGSGMYNRAKHIDTRIYRIREYASGDNPQVKLYKISGEYHPADIFTKRLKGRRHVQGL